MQAEEFQGAFQFAFLKCVLVVIWNAFYAVVEGLFAVVQDTVNLEIEVFTEWEFVEPKRELQFVAVKGEGLEVECVLDLCR